jgi:hypothetical protein
MLYRSIMSSVYLNALSCRKAITKRRVLALAILFFGLMAPWTIDSAISQQINAADVEAIHRVVQLQLDAFAEDDAVKAFDLSTSSTQDLLGTPGNFLQLIKEEYPAVYRNRSAFFSATEIFDEQALQVVQLTDPDDYVWVAIYRVQREADGSWKIQGCKLLQTTSILI